MRTEKDISLFFRVNIEINIIYEYDLIYFSCIEQTIIYTHKLLFFIIWFLLLALRRCNLLKFKGNEGGYLKPLDNRLPSYQ